MEHLWNNADKGKNRGTWGKTCPSDNFPQQIPHGLTWDEAWTPP